ncbi:MAG: hypothetical protein ACJAUV_001864 [Flavobacteriales bacterium]|jgi:uncharacterized protein (DUF3820 family)
MFDATSLDKLITTKMPFGKFEGLKLYKLPVSYLEWFQRKGFPTGKLGMLLETMLVIKSNGLDHLLYPLIKKHETSFRSHS